MTRRQAVVALVAVMVNTAVSIVGTTEPGNEALWIAVICGTTGIALVALLGPYVIRR